MTDTVGQKLIQARKLRGVTLEDAARATRIRIYYLQALEADDLASLPSPAHCRGFLRSYADYLGLDPSEFQTVEAKSRSVVKQPVIKAHIKGQKKPPIKPDDINVSNDHNKVDPDQLKSNQAPIAESELLTLQPISSRDEDQAVTETPADEIKTTDLPEVPDAEHQIPGSAEKSNPPPPISRKPASQVRTPQYPIPEQADDVPKTSQEMFVEIGLLLKERRESLNLSMDEVERFTHLRLHHLKTLESGHMEDLASPVQARGMLSNYARFLNLDDEKILLEYANGLQTRRMERVHTHTKTPLSKTVSRPGIRRFISLDLVVGILLIIAMSAFLVWGLSQVMNSQKQVLIHSTLPPVSEVLGVSPTNTPGPSALLTPASTNGLLPDGTQAPPDNNPNAANPTSDTALATGIPAAGGQNPGLAQTPSGNGKTTAAGPIQVYVIARNSAWMKVNVDGQVAFIGRVVPGNAYTYNANKKIEVLTGDASALQVLYNQTDLGNLGVMDQVVDLIFTDKGQVNPTATITPSPTRVLTSTNGPSPTATPSSTGSPLANGTANPPTTPTPTALTKSTAK